MCKTTDFLFNEHFEKNLTTDGRYDTKEAIRKQEGTKMAED